VRRLGGPSRGFVFHPIDDFRFEKNYRLRADLDRFWKRAAPYAGAKRTFESPTSPIIFCPFMCQFTTARSGRWDFWRSSELSQWVLAIPVSLHEQSHRSTPSPAFLLLVWNIEGEWQAHQFIYVAAIVSAENEFELPVVSLGILGMLMLKVSVEEDGLIQKPKRLKAMAGIDDETRYRNFGRPFVCQKSEAALTFRREVLERSRINIYVKHRDR
jgi:hypothetical protein